MLRVSLFIDILFKRVARNNFDRSTVKNLFKSHYRLKVRGEEFRKQKNLKMINTQKIDLFRNLTFISHDLRFLGMQKIPS